MRVHDIVVVVVDDIPRHFLALRESEEQCGWYVLNEEGEILFLTYGSVATRDKFWHFAIRYDKPSHLWQAIIEDHTKGLQYVTASDPEMYACMGKALLFASKGLWKARSRTRSACGCGGMSSRPSLDYYDRLKDPGNPIYFLHPKRRQ